MRLLRGMLGLLLWILAGLLALVSLLLCVTIILLPLGIPLFRMSRSLFGKAVRLMLPRALAHPVKESRRKGRTLTPDPPDLSGRAAKVRKKARSATGRRRKLFA
jgi:hypothetical protein